MNSEFKQYLRESLRLTEQSGEGRYPPGYDPSEGVHTGENGGIRFPNGDVIYPLGPDGTNNGEWLIIPGDGSPSSFHPPMDPMGGGESFWQTLQRRMREILDGLQNFPDQGDHPGPPGITVNYNWNWPYIEVDVNGDGIVDWWIPIEVWLPWVLDENFPPEGWNPWFERDGWFEDRNGDGIPDAFDYDSDGDGIPDSYDPKGPLGDPPFGGDDPDPDGGDDILPSPPIPPSDFSKPGPAGYEGNDGWTSNLE